MPQTRGAAGERDRLERSITRQVWLVTTLRLAGQDADEERRRLHDLEVRRALLATAGARRPPPAQLGHRGGPRAAGRAPSPADPRVVSCRRPAGGGRGRVQ
jgi:hypothetical protein